MRFIIRTIAALALASLALPVAAQDKVRVLLDWFVNPDHAALVIAQQRGLFAKQGLAVELIAPADPNAPPKLVAAGQADYAVSYQPTLQMLVAEGLPLVRVGVLVAQPLNSLVALDDGPIKSIGADHTHDKIDGRCQYRFVPVRGLGRTPSGAVRLSNHIHPDGEEFVSARRKNTNRLRAVDRSDHQEPCCPKPRTICSPASALASRWALCCAAIGCPLPGCPSSSRSPSSRSA